MDTDEIVKKLEIARHTQNWTHDGVVRRLVEFIRLEGGKNPNIIHRFSGMLDEMMEDVRVKPPRVLAPGPIPELGELRCPECEQPPYVTPGVFWFAAEPECEPGIQVVQRCEECERYPNDEAAARAVAARYGLEAVFLEDRPWDITGKDRGKGYGCYGVRKRTSDNTDEPPAKEGP